VLVCNFTKGSCTLKAFNLTPQGYEWGKNNKELSIAQGYSTSFYEKAQLLLTDKFLGFFMVPNNQ